MVLIGNDKKKSKFEERASNRPNTYKRFSRTTVSKFGFPAKISKNNFTEAINEITNYIFENRNDDIELTKELVLLEARLSDCQFLDNADASLRDTLSQFRTVVVSLLTSTVSITSYANYGTSSSVIVATIATILVSYFLLYLACTTVKGQTNGMRGLYNSYDKKIMALIDMLGGNYPERLSEKQKGEFLVGYYQQRSANIKDAMEKKTKNR